MTQEDKELLLKDLSARLPYDVMVNVDGYDTEKLIGIENETITTKATPTSYSDKGEYPIDIVKPYLRPMSSMTEDEKIELKQISNDYLDDWEHTKTSLERWKLDAKVSYKRAVFYNSHHLDWNDLISKGLAIKVTEKNNPYKE